MYSFLFCSIDWAVLGQCSYGVLALKRRLKPLKLPSLPGLLTIDIDNPRARMLVLLVVVVVVVFKSVLLCTRVRVFTRNHGDPRARTLPLHALDLYALLSTLVRSESLSGL